MKKNWIDRTKKLSEVARKLRKNFELWNYREVLLPSVEEFNESLDKGLKFADGENFYLIKPDITSQILNGLKTEKTRKLFYLSEVLDEEKKGSWQFGAEYIGGEDGWMVVEILTSLITALEALGIEDFYIDIGSRKVWESVTADIPQLREKVFEALYHRSFDLLEEVSLPEEKKKEIWRLFNYRDKFCSYDKLNEVLQIVQDERLFADFGTVRGLSYYDDLTFEVYSSRVGSPIGVGGEYKFRGSSCCGFAFDLEQVVKTSNQEVKGKRRKIQGNPAEVLVEAKSLVESEVPIEVKL